MSTTIKIEIFSEEGGECARVFRVDDKGIIKEYTELGELQAGSPMLVTLEHNSYTSIVLEDKGVD